MKYNHPIGHLEPDTSCRPGRYVGIINGKRVVTFPAESGPKEGHISVFELREVPRVRLAAAAEHVSELSD